MKLKYYIIISFIVFVFSGNARAWQQDYHWIEPELLYEISSFPSSGFFSAIHSISINPADNILYVLHNTPAVLSRYYAATGEPIDQIRISQRVEAPAGVSLFDNTIFIISQRSLKNLTPTGSLRSPWTNTLGKRDVKVDLATAYFDQTLWLIDTEQGIIYSLNSAAKKLTQLYPKSKSRKGKKPALNIIDATTAFPNVLLVLDGKSSMVYKFMANGKMADSFSMKAAFATEDHPNIVSIATDQKHNIWALNKDENTLDVFDSFGELTARVKDTGEFGFRFLSPSRIRIDDDDRLYVVDDGSRSIKVFDISDITTN